MHPALLAFPHTPEEHFRLLFYGAVLELREAAPDAVDRLPFLGGYYAQVDDIFDSDADAWWRAIEEWERVTAAALPLCALRAAAGLTLDDLRLLFIAATVEEDGRFGAIFELAHGELGRARPTVGLLCTWVPALDVRAGVRRLREAGMLATEPDEPSRMGSALTPTPTTWDAIRGDRPQRPAPWARVRAPHEFPELGELIAPPQVRDELLRLPAVLRERQAHAVVIRGPHAGGRRTAAGALARALHRGVLELDAAALTAANWSQAGVLATVLGALPVVTLDAAPGQSIAVPAALAHREPLVVILGRSGGVSGPGVRDAITVELPIPAATERHAHWAAAMNVTPTTTRPPRMTGGNLRATAALARAQAALHGRDTVLDDDVRAAGAQLHRRLLDTLAEPAEPASWELLCVSDETLAELDLLTVRIRERERLGAAGGRALAGAATAGVRALLVGPSGTGKTLAARALAARAGLDLYRLDVSMVVDKYIGETEKNLARVLGRAEEADVALLLDEGDALLGPRTTVASSNDRYANLETNFLLSRLETFEGVLLITTNAADRIDGAFRRRMDVVVEFTAPDAVERHRLWASHLPAAHRVDEPRLREVTARCALTGGQIRNAALHATLLALRDERAVDGAHVLLAVHREYRKAGQACPLAAEVAGAP